MRLLALIAVMIAPGCAYSRIELANKDHGTRFVTSANIRGLKIKLTQKSATMEAVDVNHSIPTKEIGNNIAKGLTGAAGLAGGAVIGL